MQSNYICLNSKTFDIEENNNIIPVDKQLAKALSILNKKGYYTKMFSVARITRPFLIGVIIHDLNEKNLITINKQTKNIIKQSDHESTIITFKENYKFNNLPKGYKFINNSLIYCLKILKAGNDLELKSLVELDKENQESIENLEKWIMSLPDNK